MCVKCNIDFISYHKSFIANSKIVDEDKNIKLNTTLMAVTVQTAVDSVKRHRKLLHTVYRTRLKIDYQNIVTLTAN